MVNVAWGRCAVRLDGELNVKRSVWLSRWDIVQSVVFLTLGAHEERSLPVVDAQKRLAANTLRGVNLGEHCDKLLATVPHTIHAQLDGDTRGSETPRHLTDFCVNAVTEHAVLEDIDDWLQKRGRDDRRGWP